MSRVPKLPKKPRAKKSVKQRKVNPWDKFCRRKLVRSDPLSLYPNSVLDPGVNFFVLMLEQMGLVTEFSCEGHPERFDGVPVTSQFYLVFRAPMDIAVQIKYTGFFAVELEGEDRWSIRRNFDSVAEKQSCLRMAAIAWENKFGKCKAKP